MKHAAHADSGGSLHPNPNSDQSTGAICTSLLWGCSRVVAAQGNQGAAQLLVLSCAGSIFSVCSLKAAVISALLLMSWCVLHL